MSEAQWDELHKESVGGYHNASAYCLMYIDATKNDIIQGSQQTEFSSFYDQIFCDTAMHLFLYQNQHLTRRESVWCR